MQLDANADRLLRALQALVETDSVNPSLVPGAAGEAEIADVTTDLLGDAGFTVTRYGPTARPSVVGRLPGGNGSTLMLNAHYDTVGVDGMEAPFDPLLERGKLYGRGAYDMKGALAACIEAGAILNDAGVGLGGDLLVAAVADEEYGSLGTADLLERRARGELTFEAAIVTEPTALALCVAHRGFTWLEVTTRGRAAHGSHYREGVDANLHMGRVLGRLEALLAQLQAGPGHPLLGPPSLHAALVRGGVGISTYSPECRLQIERRTIPPETREGVEDEIAAILDALAKEDPSFDAEWRTFFHREPFETSPEAPIARCLSAAAQRLLGTPPPVIGDSPWMDAALLASAGVDTVVMGPAGAGAHAAVEWVDVDSCLRLAEILAYTAVNRSLVSQSSRARSSS